uniref:U3 small nucleolar RNA-associated protein 6 N-terminal domain-containing protein n=1 Tax=Micromonas pusilla TaxID=38833 RepID=A0A7R9T9Z0_MICPS|mmetsp:Transcript_12027/g.43337  ORF Transcript_12027/g.43337 Transcript_12027/m.43337 type:complete len:291 (+) Transcript_12027:135-1007(+)
MFIVSQENAIHNSDALEKSGAFSRLELTQIAQKRAHFEHAIRRRALVSRYVRYIKFEKDLHDLYSARMVEHSKRMRFCGGEVSKGIIRIVYTLFQRALSKFRGNVGLWLELTTFCYTHGSQRLLSEVISHALQLNPSCSGLWSFASLWEYEKKGDVAAARRLFMRGLRISNQSKVLWISFFRFESSYLSSLCSRSLCLGCSEIKAIPVSTFIFKTAVENHPADFTFHLQLIYAALALQDPVISCEVAYSKYRVAITKPCFELLSSKTRPIFDSTVGAVVLLTRCTWSIKL